MSDRVTVEKLPDGRLVACKTARTADDEAALVREAAVLDRAQHPGVVELVAMEPAGPEPARLVMVMAGDRSLAHAPHLSAPRAAAVIAAIAATLSDLHSIGVVHGRVEPSHIVLAADGRPVLCGFSGAAIDPGEEGPQPHEDVAALGRLVRHLLEVGTEPEPIPDRRLTWRRSKTRWSGYQQRALLTLADQASAHDPRHRPSARAFAAAVAEAFPEAPPPEAAPVEALPPRRPAAHPAAETHRPAVPTPGGGPPRWRSRTVALGAAAAGIVGLTSLVTGVGALRTGARPTTAAPAPVSSTVLDAAPATSTPASPGGTAGTTTPPPACPAAEGPVADLDGDGCARPVRVDRTVVATDGGRFAVGEEDDRVVVGDWDCDGSSTPAVLRAATGEVFVFERWATTDRDETVEATTVVADSTGARVDVREGCDVLVVETAAGDQAVDLDQVAP